MMEKVVRTATIPVTQLNTTVSLSTFILNSVGQGTSKFLSVSSLISHWSCRWW